MDSIFKQTSYSQFLPLRQSSKLSDETLPLDSIFKQNSYSQFKPLRQSSTLSDETLLMNGTEVYANISTVWHEGFVAREKAKEKALQEMDALNDGMREETLYSTLSNSSNFTLRTTFTNNFDETLWMEALGSSFPQNGASIGVNEESMCESFHTALDFTLQQEDTDTVNNECTDQESLDEFMSLNVTLAVSE